MLMIAFEPPKMLQPKTAARNVSLAEEQVGVPGTAAGWLMLSVNWTGSQGTWILGETLPLGVSR